MAREAGDAFRIGLTLTGLGYMALLQGDHERATARCAESLALARELGSAGVELIPENLINLGLAARDRGDHEQAKASFEEALVMSRDVGRKPSIVNALEGMASLAGALGEAARTARLWGAAEASREVIGVVLAPGERALHEPYLAAARSQQGEAVWEETLAEGRTISLEEAVEYALSEHETATSASPVPEVPSADQPPVALTHREKEVTVLVAKELTNRQIASQLMLSEHTVATHVRNVLKKLGLRSRTQIAAWFTEQQPPP